MSSRARNALKAVRIVFCKHGGSSVGVRSFLESIQTYRESFQIHLEASVSNGHHPHLFAEYDPSLIWFHVDMVMEWCISGQFGQKVQRKLKM